MPQSHGESSGGQTAGDSPPNTQPEQITVRVEDLAIVTPRWLEKSSTKGWAPPPVLLIQYFKAVQELLASKVLAPSINANTQAIKQLTKDMDAMKAAVAKRTTSTPFRDALLRAPSKKEPPPPPFKNHEIIVKMGADMVNATRCMTEEELMKQIDENAIKNNIEDIHIRAVNKLTSGDIAIQTRNAEKTMRLKENKAWVQSLYSDEARIVAKTYPVMIHTHKMRTFLNTDPAQFRLSIKAFNAGLEPMHVAPFHKGGPENVGLLIMVFRTKKEANEAIQNGIVIEGKIHTARVYNRECRVKQCFKCYKYGHLSSRCTNKQCCGRCDHEHATPMRGDSQNECNKDNPDRCAAYGKTHPAWSKSCNMR